MSNYFSVLNEKDQKVSAGKEGQKVKGKQYWKFTILNVVMKVSVGVDYQFLSSR